MKVQIGSLTYQVMDAEVALSPEGDEVFGSTHHGPGEIHIARTIHGEEISPTVRQDTLMHEILHACYFAAGSPLDDQEELAVTTLSLRLLEALQGNPELVARLVTPHE